MLMPTNERLRQIRQASGLSQVKFAERIAIAHSYIADMEHGKKPVNERIIRLIAAEFNVNADWLRNGIGEMQSDNDAFAIAEMTRLYRSMSAERQGLAIALLRTMASFDGTQK